MASTISSGDILTNEQLKNSIKIYAGPGAGKTYFLVENIKNIISQNEKIRDSNIRSVLCITYTNAAVDEIKNRLGIYNKRIEVYTIHGFIIRHIIYPYQSELRRLIKEDFDIVIGGDKPITSQVEGLGLLHGIDRESIYDYIEKETGREVDYSKTSLSRVQIDLEHFISEGEMLFQRTKKIDPDHVKTIKKFIWDKARKLTHDEILYFGYRLVESNSTIAYLLRVQFPFIFVDEFQDTNPLQTKLLKLIGQQSTVIGVIGDVAQSIYSFQGARPSMFSKFDLYEREVNEFYIKGNRRSTRNIIHMCNYIRQHDDLSQISVKEYDSDGQKRVAESKKVIFLQGDSSQVMDRISDVVSEGGVVLTRAWAAAFQYMDNVSDKQKDILKKIYNSYYISPIDIRAEITEHSNVTWVKTFKFIFSLVDAFQTNSVIDIINSFRFYIDTTKAIKNGEFSIKNLLLIRDMLLAFSGSISPQITMREVVAKFNVLLKKEDYIDIYDILAVNSKDNGTEKSFELICFHEYDRENLVNNVNSLEWNTAYTLFRKVFSPNSSYMTVHQAKGLEWDKVIVSLTPTKFDKTLFYQMFVNPGILEENPQDEFARLFYVACSRAKEELYIHLNCTDFEIKEMKDSLKEYCEKEQIEIFYDFA